MNKKMLRHNLKQILKINKSLRKENALLKESYAVQAKGIHKLEKALHEALHHNASPVSRRFDTWEAWEAWAKDHIEQTTAPTPRTLELAEQNTRATAQESYELLVSEEAKAKWEPNTIELDPLLDKRPETYTVRVVETVEYLVDVPAASEEGAEFAAISKIVNDPERDKYVVGVTERTATAESF